MRRGSLLLALALLGGVCIGCEELADETTADFSFVSTKQVLRLSGGTPAVEITIENTGDRAGYNVSCDVNALKGNTIIDGASAYFADLNDIPPGQRAVDDAIFWGMGSHKDYDRLDYRMTWIERDTYKSGEVTQTHTVDAAGNLIEKLAGVPVTVIVDPGPPPEWE